jgi:hypothetical protein
VPARYEAKRFTARPITLERALAVERLPPHHRGPFDRMPMAQATVEASTIRSGDPPLRSDAVRLILGQPPRGPRADCGWIDTGGIDRASSAAPWPRRWGGARPEPPSPRTRRTRKTVSDQAAACAAAAAA